MTLERVGRLFPPRARIVIGSAALALACAAAYLALRAPTYTASAVIQLQRGPSTVRKVEDLSAALAEEPPSEPEIEHLRSRSLARIVVERLGLDVRTRARTLPLVGDALARRHHGPGLAPPRLGLDRFAWGGERIRLDQLSVSDDLEGRRIRITARASERISVEIPGAPPAEGRVGERVSVRAGRTWVELRVVDLVARPGTGFDVWRQRPGEAERELLDRLAVAERGKQTGLLVVGLVWDDRARVAEIVDDVAGSYLRESAVRRAGEAARTLDFLEDQLPVLRGELAIAEAELVSYRSQHLPVALPGGVGAMIAQATAARKELSQLALERAEAHRRFESHHSSVAALDDRATKLREELAALTAQMRELPEEGVQSVRLARDVEVGRALYLLVLERVYELQVVKAGASGNARIVDRPSVPDAPVTPQPLPVLAGALLLGLVAGRAAASAWSDLDDRDATPERIERSTGLSFYGGIPHSSRQRALARRGADGASPVLSAIDPRDAAVEALRSVAAGLEFAVAEARNNVVAVTGPRPGLGKSFVAVNLAAVLASAGRRVLLVDADLRRGELHRRFSHARRPGLAELVVAAAPTHAAVRGSGVARLDLLSTGHLPPNPAELLAGDRFRRVLQASAARYDVVLVDTPPVLVAADAAIVARLAGVVLLVLRAGRTSVREVDTAVKRLAHAGVRINGAVMNELATAAPSYR
jgi:tyrosine-protein kinase Etk/Wzc